MAGQQRNSRIIRTSQPDYWLIVSIFFLLCVGTVMVFSSSTVSSYLMKDSDSYTLLRNQIIYAGLGVIIMFLASFVSYKLIERMSVAIYVISVALLGLVLLIGANLNNARRWIKIGPVSFQPSEIAKFGMIVFLAYILSNEYTKKIVDKWWGFIVYILPLGVAFFLLYKEPHVSCIVIIILIAVIMMFIGGVKPRVFLILGALGVAGVVLMYFTVPHVQTRLNSFLGIGDTAEVSSSAEYQITQSLYAIGSGGFAGRGLGKSVQKYQYLPEAYNDFIFSILAEELGFIGVILVLALFGILIWRGCKIASYAPDKFSCLLATGITSLIAVQTIMNVAVATKLMPVTGVALPFFSYGGTSLCIIMAEMGVLLGISKKTAYDKF